MQDRGMRGQLGRFALLAAAVVAVGLASGWLYGKGQPRAAAGAVVADFVEVTDSLGNDRAPADADAVAPASGNHDGTVRCGVLADPVDNDDHLESLAAGVIVIRWGTQLPAAEVEKLAAFAAGRDALLVAPEPRLDIPLVALGWSQRLALADVNEELLAAFHTARVGLAPDATDHPCP